MQRVSNRQEILYINRYKAQLFIINDILQNIFLIINVSIYSTHFNFFNTIKMSSPQLNIITENLKWYRRDIYAKIDI